MMSFCCMLNIFLIQFFQKNFLLQKLWYKLVEQAQREQNAKWLKMFHGRKLKSKATN